MEIEQNRLINYYTKMVFPNLECEEVKDEIELEDETKSQERKKIIYNDKEKEKFKKQIKEFNEEFDFDISKKKYNIYPNQTKTAEEVVQNFRDRRITHQMIIAPCQSGKTGLCNAIIKEYINKKYIDINNIYYFTGLSSKAWMNQSKERFPESLKNIWHNPKLEDLGDIMANKKNVLIMIDECHIANGQNNNLGKLFDKSICYKMFENDIKIILISATPGQTFKDLQKMRPQNYKKIYMKEGRGYVSLKKLHEDNRLMDFKPLYSSSTQDKIKIQKNLENLNLTIEMNYQEPKYHLIRIKKNYDEAKENITEFFGDMYTFKEFNQKSFEKDINSLTKTIPRKHTIIFVQNMLMCSITLEYKQHIGILYDSISKSDNVNVQSFPGRACGYYDFDSIKIIIFTNVKSIEKYIENYDNKTLEQLKYSNTKPTTSDPDYLGINKINESKSEDIVVKEFSTFNQLKIFCKTLDYDLQNKYKDNIGEFKTCTIRNVTKVWKVEEIINDKRWGINEKYTRRHAVGYKDLEDLNTETYILIYKL